MLIIENPIFALIIALGILIFFLSLFKVINYFDSKKSKSVKSDKKEEKTLQVEVVNEEYIEPNTNYLYDRFVIDPTSDDMLTTDDKISDVFLNNEDYQEIKNHKVDIKVESVNSNGKSDLYKKIEELTHNNRSEKDKLLDEFNGLSREMKLLLIENILQKLE